MRRFIYRVVLVAKETKTRGKVLSGLETTSRREAEAEVKALQEMTARPSWKLATEISITRATVSEFELIPGNEIFSDDEETATPPASP